MAEYIEREAAIHALRRRLGPNTSTAQRNMLQIAAIEIRRIKSADVAHVVNGRWEWYEEWMESSPDGPAECQNAGWQCSECKIDLAEYLSETLGETVYCDDPDRYPTINRCPNCGASMDKEE